MMMKKSKFIKVRCPDCETVQTIFDHPSVVVECIVCGRTLCLPTGGKGEVKAEIVQILE